MELVSTLNDGFLSNDAESRRNCGAIQRHSNREPWRTLPNDLEAPTGAKRWWNHWPECVPCFWDGGRRGEQVLITLLRAAGANVLV